MKFLLTAAAVLVAFAPAAAEQPEGTTLIPTPPLSQAHAHNDYWHDRPLLDALARGFCSVEADVFLWKGELLVGHDVLELRNANTLEKLYLEPLRERFDQLGGACADGSPLTLLVDFKNEGEATYAALDKLLEKYSDMLTKVDAEGAHPGAVTVIISGDRPQETIAADEVRYAGIDGRLSDLESEAPADLIPLISDNWTSHFKWRGVGEMPDEERQKLHDIVRRTHKAGRRLRFWATPETPDMWRELAEAGVDLIGTDDLDALANFLMENAPKEAAANENTSKANGE